VPVPLQILHSRSPPHQEQSGLFLSTKPLPIPFVFPVPLQGWHFPVPPHLMHVDAIADSPFICG
jgi:hypothetical protein